MPRDPLQTKIQIARRQLAIEDGDYRDLLERVTGKRSSTKMTRAELARVLKEMKALGFREQAKSQRRPHAPRQDQAYIHVLWRKLADAGHVDLGRQALNRFIAGPHFRGKWGRVVTDVDFLGQEWAYDVIEALKDMCRRHRIDPTPVRASE